MTTSTTTALRNPYVGPSTFSYAARHLYFGRESEARSLLARVVSARLLLFYAQSGAGKSSLINTRLIPQLREEEGFSVLPMGRVSGQLPADVVAVDNLFVFNLLASLDQSGSNPARLTHLTLTEFLAHLVTDDGLTWRYEPLLAVETMPMPTPPTSEATSSARFALIIDQFEEIFTTHPERWQEREAFFRQLEAALAANPNLWVVLTLREDYVAALDPYSPLLFNRLRARFYMKRMDVNAALEAVQAPAKLYGRPFAPGVAEVLVQDLSRIKVLGQMTAQPGQYVELVQLQVVCYQLWENVRSCPAGPITQADLPLGYIDQALTHFYEDALADTLRDLAVQQAGVSECTLRIWFTNELITETGIRNILLRNEQAVQTGSLANAAVDHLVRCYLLRTELRAGGAWVELVHDRFVEPIRQSNQVWLVNLSSFQRQAMLWHQRGRPNDLLLSGDALIEAEHWANEHSGELESYEQDFLTVARQARIDWAEHLAQTAMVLLPQQRDLALLLAVEANREAVTLSTRNTLLWSLQEDVHLGPLSLPQVMQGHRGAINFMTVSPDGKLFATGGVDARILLWNLLERKPMSEPLLGHSNNILVLTFSPDGRLLASAGVDGSILFWDVATHQRIGPALYGHYAPVWGLAFSPNGRLLASSDQSGQIVIWDLWTWMSLEDHKAPESLPSGRTVHYLKGHKAEVWWLEFRPQGDILASASFDGTVCLWNVQNGQQMAKLDNHNRAVACVVFSQDGKRLASSDWEGFLSIWDVAKQQQILEWQGHSAAIPGITFSPDGSLLASGGWDGHVMIWDSATGEKVHPPLVHPPLSREFHALLSGYEKISCLAFTPNGQELVSGDLGGTVLVWNVATGAQVSPPLKEHKVSANSVAITPDGHTLIGGCSDGALLLWDLPAFQIRGAPLRGHRSTVSWVRVSSDGKYVVSADWGGDLVIWQTAERQLLATLRKYDTKIFGAAFSPDGHTLASSSADGRILIWSLDDRRLLKEMRIESGSALMVAYQPAGSLLASAHQDGIVRLWDPTTGQIKAELEGHHDAVFTLAWHPTGQFLASGGRDGYVWLWDMETYHALREPLSIEDAHNALIGAGCSAESVKPVDSGLTDNWGPYQTICSLVFSPDGEILGSGAVSGAVTLWDVKRWSLLGLPLWSGSPIALDMAFTPDGNQLITAHGDGKIHRWATGDVTWRQLACHLAGRELTVEERQKYLR